MSPQPARLGPEAATVPCRAVAPPHLSLVTRTIFFVDSFSEKDVLPGGVEKHKL